MISMNVAGMILGIIAIMFAIIPLFGALIAVPCFVVGLPLSSVSFVKKKRVGEGIGMALAGMATNTVAMVMVIGWVILVILGFTVFE